MGGRTQLVLRMAVSPFCPLHVQAQTFPFVGLLATVGGRTQLVLSVAGAVTAGELLAALAQATSNFEPQIVAQRMEQEEQVRSGRHTSAC